MSAEEVAIILDRLETIQREQSATKAELANVRRELVMARRNSAKPYYTTEELQALTGKRTRPAVYAWATRKGISSSGHNQWPRQLIDQVLGLD